MTRPATPPGSPPRPPRVPGVLRRNLRLKVVAVLIALVTWAGVVYASNPPQSRVLDVHVPQARTSIPAKYVLVHAIPDIQLVLSGTADHLNAFDQRSLVISVDYASITGAGTLSLPIHITNSDPNVEVTSAPSTVQADIDTNGSRDVPVVLVINPPPPFGYVVVAQKLNPSVITLIGPSHELATARAVVGVDMSNQKTNLDNDVPVKVVAPDGSVINDVGLEQPTVRVTLTVQATQTSRATAVVPAVTGQVANGYRLTGIVVTPSTAVINGPRDLLNGLDSVSTQVIPLDGMTHTTTVTVKVVPPAGITATPSLVTVELIVAAVPTPTPAPAPPPTPTPTP